ncbi:MAG: hypothetical protein ING66_17040 [Rhodocyclaceae bacterium]|jgi:hypothetical protein|nr:hypothetical protein [Rhodocyclaceae bacterium]MCE2724663.1 hypothetical protein [Betaproteobacteria bacterium]MCA3017997.1 hypothetical protein [Rhodocyclaceae bacterium]MCA3021569.1 hypothetical protein [Rhodocyclaceae bacterium]MCA3026614.1 hypothetical protein [Rhodocyclaceae bacterium]
MRVLAATEVKNRLGEALSFEEDDSLLIEKNGKAAFMAFSAPLAKRMVLSSYVQGAISRSAAMKLLGFEWYGQLLDALTEANLARPSLPKEARSAMSKHALKVLGR